MLKRLLIEEEGQTLVEYGLLISLIALVVIVVLAVTGKKVSNTFNTAKDHLYDPRRNGPPGPVGNPNR